jgi:hypothetical protein
MYIINELCLYSNIKTIMMNLFDQSEDNDNDNKQIHSGKQTSLSCYMDLAGYAPR